jgi:hypothetical protein
MNNSRRIEDEDISAVFDRAKVSLIAMTGNLIFGKPNRNPGGT